MTNPTNVQWKSLVPERPTLVAWLVLVGVVAWAYAAVFYLLVLVWYQQMAEYGHGFVVPIFAAVLLWVRRELIVPLPTEGTWWGIPLLALWAIMRWTSAYFFYQVFDSLSLLPFLAGLTLVVGGWRALRWAWPTIAFLVFMIPLPDALANALRNPLQRVGTYVSVFVIQTLGIPAIANGNVIQLTEGQLGVVEACSGLRMLMLFFAVCVGAALILRCELWEKIVIVISAMPIAVFSNVSRITITAILYEMARKWPSVVSTETADWFFHKAAGALMMPLAMLVLWGEIVLLRKLFLQPVTEGPLAMRPAVAGVSRPAAPQQPILIPRKRKS